MCVCVCGWGGTSSCRCSSTLRQTCPSVSADADLRRLVARGWPAAGPSGGSVLSFVVLFVRVAGMKWAEMGG